jgi:hypothetical protein
VDIINAKGRIIGEAEVLEMKEKDAVASATVLSDFKENNSVRRRYAL